MRVRAASPSLLIPGSSFALALKIICHLSCPFKGRVHLGHRKAFQRGLHPCVSEFASTCCRPARQKRPCGVPQCEWARVFCQFARVMAWPASVTCLLKRYRLGRESRLGKAWKQNRARHNPNRWRGTSRRKSNRRRIPCSLISYRCVVCCGLDEVTPGAFIAWPCRA